MIIRDTKEIAVVLSKIPMNVKVSKEEIDARLSKIEIGLSNKSAYLYGGNDMLMAGDDRLVAG